MAQRASSAEASAEFLSRLLSCTHYSDVGDFVLQPVAEEFAATSGVFLQFYDMPRQMSTVGRNAYVGDAPQSVEAYADGFYQSDPIVKPSLRRLRRPENADDPYINLLSPIPAVTSSDYYRRFLKPFDISHILALAIPVRTALRSEVLCIGLHRRHGAEPFASADVGRLYRLAPALQTVLSNVAHRDTAAVASAVLDGFSEKEPDIGFVILDHDLEFIDASSRGLEDLGLIDGNCDDRDGLVPSDMFGALRHSLLNLPPPDAPRDAALEMSLSCASSGRTVAVTVRTLVDARGEQRYLLRTCIERPPPALDTVCSGFGLSARETEVAMLAAGGCRNSDIARTLSISVNTVENHLKSIFSKVDVTSRTQLVARLLGTC